MKDLKEQINDLIDRGYDTDKDIIKQLCIDYDIIPVNRTMIKNSFINASILLILLIIFLTFVV